MLATSGIMVSGEDVEAVIEADNAFIASPDPGNGRPAVNAYNVIEKCCCRADEAARHSRAVTWRMRARLAVSVLVIIGWLGCAAMSSIWALHTNAFHQALHGVASAVAACGDATHMTLARGLELVAA